MLLLTKYVQIQFMLTCLVSDLICQGLCGEAPDKRRLARQTQYCNLLLFYDGCGNCPYLLYSHQFWMYILFLRSTLIPLRHLLRHFIFLSKAFFVPFTCCVHVSIKKKLNWNLSCYSLYHFFNHEFCLKCQHFSQGSREMLSPLTTT